MALNRPYNELSEKLETVTINSRQKLEDSGLKLTENSQFLKKKNSSNTAWNLNYLSPTRPNARIHLCRVRKQPGFGIKYDGDEG